MTASNLQVLPVGPVQIIGLPPATAEAMGVTNARISHRRLLNNNNGSLNNNNNSTPSSLGSARRCLFGSPDPGETQKLYATEMKRNRRHMIERYNFDIRTGEFVSNSNDRCSGSSSSQTEDDDSDHEKLSCENRLQEGNRDSPENRDNSSEQCNLDSATESSAALRGIGVDKSLAAPKTPLKDKKTGERLKPYSRQTMIPDYFGGFRKSSTMSSAVSKKLTVSQLPQPQKADLLDPVQQIRQNGTEKA